MLIGYSHILNRSHRFTVLFSGNQFNSIVSTLSTFGLSCREKMDSENEINGCNTRTSILLPPVSVRGLTRFNKEAFLKTVEVPYLQFDGKVVNATLLRKVINRYLLRIPNFKSFQAANLDACVSSSTAKENRSSDSIRKCFLNPDVITSFHDIPDVDRSELEKLHITEKSFNFMTVTLSIDNWNANLLLKAVLPEDKDALSSYSIIGHIVHLNIRDHLLPYKYIIGEILLAKVVGAKTIVNKLDIIDNTYRNFKMEVICGENNFVTKVKQNYCTFEFDFSAVYWNPRLSTEHERIIGKLNPGDTLYDVFAGVGPFSIPACKRKCFVLANDLNPESFKWLVHNSKLNKVCKLLKAFNEDGFLFIKNVVKTDMLEKWASESFAKSTMHVAMNLPALAVTFLKAFRGLFTEAEMSSLCIVNYPIVHVYCFCRSEDLEAEALQMVEENLGYKISDNLIEICNVRNVSTNKDMLRVSFKLFREVLIDSSFSDSSEDLDINISSNEILSKRKNPEISGENNSYSFLT